MATSPVIGVVTERSKRVGITLRYLLTDLFGQDNSRLSYRSQDSPIDVPSSVSVS